MNQNGKSTNSNTKLMIVVVRWFLGLVSACIIALGSLGYNNIINGQTELKTKIEALDQKVDALDQLKDMAIMGDSLQGRDILDVEKGLEGQERLLEKHMEEGHRP